MADRMYRIGIVGASSLAGKELSDELSESLLGASTLCFWMKMSRLDR